MEDKILELRYVQAKEELINSINSIPQKYGISFILINEMIRDIAKQVEVAAINDRRAVEKMLNQNNKKEAEE
jgi:hypothetical protein